MTAFQRPNGATTVAPERRHSSQYQHHANGHANGNGNGNGRLLNGYHHDHHENQNQNHNRRNGSDTGSVRRRNMSLLLHPNEKDSGPSSSSTPENSGDSDDDGGVPTDILTEQKYFKRTSTSGLLNGKVNMHNDQRRKGSLHGQDQRRRPPLDFDAYQNSLPDTNPDIFLDPKENPKYPTSSPIEEEESSVQGGDLPLRHGFAEQYNSEEYLQLLEQAFYMYYNDKRHDTGGRARYTDSAFVQEWRMKDRLKTVSAALVLCLNIGVDPPGKLSDFILAIASN
ncbi:hypothetical protein ABW21_db0201050 [Orbilia brochopaga]|nr:hypothetical protein ABW21_db0201050 [Drechslerella brochopaga]